jgi:hypothetical protein
MPRRNSNAGERFVPTDEMLQSLRNLAKELMHAWRHKHWRPNH